MVEQRSPKPSIWVRILVLLPVNLKGLPEREVLFRIVFHQVEVDPVGRVETAAGLVQQTGLFPGNPAGNHQG